jgi:hypothetical protein
MENMKIPEQIKADEQRSKSLRDFIIAFAVPTLVGKVLIFYFGIHYSNEPGEGYGYGLIASIAFTVINALRFIWKYRNTEDI